MKLISLLIIILFQSACITVYAQSDLVETKSVEEFVNRGKEQLAEGNTDRAIEYFYNALEIDPDYAPAYTQLSNAFRSQAPWDGFDRSEVDMAISFGEKAVFLDPDDPEARMALGMAYYWKRWYRLAYPHIRHADELNASAETAAALGVMEIEMGNFDRALNEFERALQFDTNNPLLLFRIGSVERILGNRERARDFIQQALEEFPDQPVLHTNIVYMLIEEEKYDEAIQYSEELVGKYPDNHRLTALAGLTYWLTGNESKATEYLEQVVELPGQDPLIGWWGTYSSTVLGHLYKHAGHTEQADAMFANSMKGYKNRLTEGAEGWGYMFDLARVYAVKGEKDKALQWLSQANEFGFPEYYMASIDPMLEEMKDVPDFRQIMADMESRIEEMRERATND